MLLRQILEKQGDWLFKRRGYLPLGFVPVILVALCEFSFPFSSQTYERAWEMFAFSTSLFGLFVRWFTVGYTPSGTSGRNTRRHKASTLNTKGMYSVTRNPLYLGNFLAMLGIAIFPRVWWVVVIYILGFWIYCERIIASEERFLLDKFGKEYKEYVARTPVFIPDFGLWKGPDVPFSLKKVLRKEYTGLFTVVFTFTCLKLISDYVKKGKIVIDDIWVGIFIFSSLMCATLSLLKKKGRLLR